MTSFTNHLLPLLIAAMAIVTHLTYTVREREQSRLPRRGPMSFRSPSGLPQSNIYVRPEEAAERGVMG